MAIQPNPNKVTLVRRAILARTASPQAFVRELFRHSGTRLSQQWYCAAPKPKAAAQTRKIIETARVTLSALFAAPVPRG